MARMSKKASLELRRKIKKAEKEKRSKALEEADKVTVVTADDGEKISFDQYWMKANKRAGLKQWMKEIIWADFAARGLSKSETESKYDSALELFGIKS